MFFYKSDRPNTEPLHICIQTVEWKIFSGVAVPVFLYRKVNTNILNMQIFLIKYRPIFTDGATDSK